jgi:hypothetical protein
MSGIDGSPSNARSCPFTFTLTIASSDGGFFKSWIAASQLRDVAGFSAADRCAPPYAVS